MRRRPRQRSEIPVVLPATLDSDTILRELADALPKDDSFRTNYLKKEYLSKFLDERIVSARERRHAAIQKFLGVEQLNRRTNSRLLFLHEDLGWIQAHQLIRDVRRLIGRVLGPWRDSYLLKSPPTSGASMGVRRTPMAPFDKLQGEQTTSTSALPYWVISASGTILGSKLEVPVLKSCEFSGLFTVPKKSDIDRVACKEPTINTMLQRSVGIAIRDRLRYKCGIDLRDQSVNQRAAQRGYSTRMATIDLSSASDTITRQLVIQLLPFEWWSVMHDLTVRQTDIDGELHELEMFSSMGNGFTFELETLIFWAVTVAVCKRSGIPYDRVVVYGDDIIAPCAVVPRLLRVLSYLGFKPNRKKTHYRGPFRESCGKHFHYDFEVTPFYVKGPLKTLPDLIHLLNSVLAWDAASFKVWETKSLKEWWEKYRSYVPRELHGGVSVSDPSCLVTGDPPRKRWIERKGKGRQASHDLGGLRYWLWSREYIQHELDCENAPSYLGKHLKLKKVSRAFGQTEWNPKELLDSDPQPNQKECLL